ncbi:MAG: DNA polymerase/3'-5' exonuclease PolX [candidate division WOR-3 bacterium]|jgi:DNA polymerase (family 10)|nr:DNA polymerase/3'-5' exonuclease PolX [candidate division WOR-3 bacterium]MCR4423331.1 DNA polymerase/3'-5' exonuclease PolX [candidate division WOR-3 bacterium]MDH7518670.1 DNA polymerase/3'-5' exonuclease PolX [bacterium]
MKNQELAQIFDQIADALELKGETGFRVLAYRKAARVLAELTEDVAELDRENRLETIPGIGSGIAKKIHEYLTTGKMQKLDEVTSGLEPGLFVLLKIPGVGPKTVRLLHQALGVKDFESLKKVLTDGSAAKLPGMGEKKVKNILQAIQTAESSGERMYLNEAYELAEAIVSHIKRANVAEQVTFAGSLRRGKETIGDIDILASGKNPTAIINRFIEYPEKQQVISAGDTKASILVKTNGGLRQVDLRVVREDEFGAALQYFTGSKDHNVALRTLAQKQGLKISEYGVFRGKEKIAGRKEREVYRALGLPYIEPELREDRGEIEAAKAGRLPRLVQLSDIKSDLHIHTDASDGLSSLEDIVTAAQKRGYTHIAIAEHSVSAGYAGGLTEDELLRRCETIDRLNEKLTGFRVLKAAEVDITPEGKLDYSDKALSQLDLVVASIHQAFNREATKRICFAIEHPLVHIIGHPSGRLINKRPGYDIDLEKVIEWAAKFKKILEINSYYARLDLNDVWAKEAKDAGVLLAVNTDAHAVADLSWMRYGVITARRAWLEKSDVVNCLNLNHLLKLLKSISRL